MAPKAKSIAPESAPKSPQRRSGPRPTSPGAHCLRKGPSPQKPKRKPKPKPAATQEEIAAQIAARIAQLSAPPAATTSQQPSVKVKSIAELRSTKIARLTTKIAVNEAEIARLEREYSLAKERLDRETATLEFRKDALTTTGAQSRTIGVTNAKTKATLAMMDDARAKLEVVADRAQDLLTRFRSGEINERSTMRELKDLLEGAKDGGCDVAGLCQMVAALDFTGSSGGEAAQAELKTARKRKVQYIRADDQKVREALAKAQIEEIMKAQKALAKDKKSEGKDENSET